MTRKTVQEMVREFHEVFDAPIGDAVHELSVSRRELRLSLIKEEFEELVAASAFQQEGNEHAASYGDCHCELTHIEGTLGDIVEMADALGDIVYVCYGMAIEMGIDLDRVVEEIHRSNMSKLGEDGKPIHREDGKVLKGPNYSAPDIASVILF